MSYDDVEPSRLYVTEAGLAVQAQYGGWDRAATGSEIITIATRPA